jgi:hypothetical protein
MSASKGRDIVSRSTCGTARTGHDIVPLQPSTRPPFDASRVYREAHARYAQAFRKGDVSAIEEAFSRMQELGRAFRDGAQWAEGKIPGRKGTPR